MDLVQAPIGAEKGDQKFTHRVQVAWMEYKLKDEKNSKAQWWTAHKK